MAFLGGCRVIWSCLYLHLFSGKLFVLLSAELLLHFDSRSLTDQLPKNAKLYGEILLNGFRQRLPYGTYVSSWTLFFLSPYVSPASRKLVSLSHLDIHWIAWSELRNPDDQRLSGFVFLGPMAGIHKTRWRTDWITDSSWTSLLFCSLATPKWATSFQKAFPGWCIHFRDGLGRSGECPHWVLTWNRWSLPSGKETAQFSCAHALMPILAVSGRAHIRPW